MTKVIAGITDLSGRRLFEGFDEMVILEPSRVLQSPFATHISYHIAY